jgi:hypothetical protein
VSLDPGDSLQPQDQNDPPPPVRERQRRLRACALFGLCLIVLFIGGALLQRGNKWGIPLGYLLISIAILPVFFAALRWLFPRWGAARVKWGSMRRKVVEPEPQDQAAGSPTKTQDPTVAASVSSVTTTAVPSPVSSVPPTESPASVPANTMSVAQNTGGSTRDSTDESPGDVDGPARTSNSPRPLSRAAILAQQKDFSRRRPRPVDSRHGGYLLDQSGTDRLFLLAGSVLGGQHDQPGLMREDDVAFYADPAATSTIVAAVADGVGSARLSHVVSALAVRIAVNELSSWLAAPSKHRILSAWEQTASTLVSTVDDALFTELLEPASLDLIGMSRLVEEEYLQRPGRPAATLAVVVVDEVPEGFLASWLTVGDCDVVITEYVTGKVTWLTGHAYRKGPRTEAVPSHRKVTRSGQHFIADGQAVVAATDGMAEVLDDGGWPALTQALAAARRRDSALIDLLTALDARQHGNYDDRSLVAIGPIGRR